MSNVIEVKHLTKKYKELTAVDDISFDVAEGEILGLLGPNGSGKSTTINCILSLLKYDGGDIKVFGEEMTPDSSDLKAKIGVVFQDVAVFDELTVRENIENNELVSKMTEFGANELAPFFRNELIIAGYAAAFIVAAALIARKKRVQ